MLEISAGEGEKACQEGKTEGEVELLQVRKNRGHREKNCCGSTTNWVREHVGLQEKRSIAVSGGQRIGGGVLAMDRSVARRHTFSEWVSFDCRDPDITRNEGTWMLKADEALWNS